MIGKIPVRKGGVREMIAIALPMVVSQACDTVMTVTDRMFLARINPELMNAAMGGGLTVFMMMTFFLGLIGYSTALVAQYLGAGRKDQCAVVTAQAMIIALFAYPIIIACRPLAHWWFSISGISAGQYTAQVAYFDIVLWGVIFGLLRISLSSFFSGIGRTRMVMAASFVAMGVNVIANYILIYGKFGSPAFGIRGAAYGTVIGSFCGLVVLAVGYLNRRIAQSYGITRSLRFDAEMMRKLVTFGSPTGCEMFLNLLAFSAVVMIFHSLGPVSATAATIMFNWDMVSFVPLIGVEIGVTSLVGRYMGARDPDTAAKATMSGLKMGLAYSGIILFLFCAFPSALVDMFRPDVGGTVFAQAKPMAVFMIRVAALYVMVEAMFVVFIGALRGAGDTRWAMFLSVTLHWILVGVMFVMLRVWGMSPQAGWMAMIAVFWVFSLLVYQRYRCGRWKTIVVVHPEKEAEALARDDFHEPADL